MCRICSLELLVMTRLEVNRMKLKIFIVTVCLVIGCGASKQLLTGDSVCVDITDAGTTQVVVNAQGIQVSIPLYMMKDASKE